MAALAAFAIGGLPGDSSGTGTTSSQQTTTQETTAVASQTLDDLSGQTYIEAVATLASYPVKVTPKRQNVRSATQDVNVVVETVPPVGTVLHDGDTVLLKTSRGQKNIPNVGGMTEAQARERLGSDFVVTSSGEASDTVAKGQVTRTDPVVGTRVPVGSSVTLWVSTGPASVQVPNLVGKSEDAARAALGSAGLITHEPPGIRCSDDVQVDQVAKQFPDTGTLVQKGREVRFDMSNSPCTVNVPSVRGKNVDVAAQQLTDLKIRYRTIFTPVSDAGQDGVVQDQNIEGTNTKPFVVTLSVGQFDQPVTSPTST